MKRGWIAAGLDLVMVLVFAAIGRRSHAEVDTVAGVLVTAWPFLVATLVGSVIAMIVRRLRGTGDAYGWGSAIVVWVTTVVGGMLLRVVSGAGVAWAFWIVAFITLGILLLGWRLTARAFLRGRAGTRIGREAR